MTRLFIEQPLACLGLLDIGRTFFRYCFVSTISTKILLLWKMWKKHWRVKNILLLALALIYGVAIYGRRKNSNRKKVLFVNNFFDSPREKSSKRRTYSLDPFYQHCMAHYTGLLLAPVEGIDCRPISGNFLCHVVTLVTFNSNLVTLKRI